ncbi:MAG: hypothetical protein FJ109_04480 [Deltaproteobacteria bacterium]|nr:hypothetical protein [Deltaproteobacteria bacterium]
MGYLRWMSLCGLAAALLLSACSGGKATLSMDLSALPDAASEAGAPETVFDLDLAEGVDGDLAPPDVSIEPGAFGWPCLTNADCLSMFCIESPNGFVCTGECIEDCPAGWSCEQVGAGPDLTYVCLPLFGTLCRPCLTDDECRQGVGKGAFCVDYGGTGRFCAAPCGEKEFCPTGYSCLDAVLGDGTTAPVCLRDGAECGCAPKYQGMNIATTCYLDNEWGTCDGGRICQDGELTPCDALVPAAEACNGADDDCDGVVDEEIPGGTCSVENEFGSCPGVPSCEAGTLICLGIAPSAEMCDGLDNDCDGEVDEGFPDLDGDVLPDCLDSDVDGDDVPNAQDNCPETPNPDQKDFDQDDLGDACDTDKDGDLDPDETDCAPFDPLAGHTLPDKCNGADDDCDGVVDELFPDLDSDGLKDCVDPDDDNDGVVDEADNCPVTFNPSQTDQDADGIGDACEDDKDGDLDPDGTDCAPQDPLIHHGAEELCNGIDDNCNGIVDEGFGDLDKDGVPDCQDPDDDNDGVLDEVDNCPTLANPDQLDSDQDGAGNACDVDDDGDGDPDVLDCKPLDPAINHAAVETCDAKDNDCDDLVDEEGTEGCSTWYYNADSDGYGLELLSKCLCAPVPPYSAKETGDCDDNNPSVHPGANEFCNGKDDDCNGQADEEGALGCNKLYPDLDFDGFGTGETLCLCGNPKGYSTVVGDCDDLDAQSKPGGTEQCDGKDNDCDGTVDEEGALGCAQFYQDQDGDGYGQIGLSKCLCKAAPPWSAQMTGDCDDAKAAVHPTAIETCNSVDDNCNGQIDEAAKTTFYKDNDGDGYGTPNDKLDACAAPAGYVTAGTDCNDFNGDIHPGAAEACDDLDNNCSGQADEGLLLLTIYKDNDGDGFAASGAVAVKKCNVPMGYTQAQDVSGDGKNDWDCNDSDATVFPGALEMCDGKDNDCNGYKDTQCPTQCPGWPVFLGPGNVQCNLALADLNNDTQKEVVVGCKQVVLKADGTKLIDLPGCDTWPRGVNIAQLDARPDFTWDVICKNRVYDINGIRADLSSNPYNTPAVGDVTGDGIPDIVSGSWDARYYVTEGQWDGSGKWSKKKTHDLLLTSVGADKSLFAPTLVDLDGNGTLDLISGSGYLSQAEGDYPDGRIYAWTFANGTFQRHCPSNPADPDQCFATGKSYWWTYFSGAVDVNLDGQVELVFPVNGGYLFDPAGAILGQGKNGMPMDWNRDGQWEWQAVYSKVAGDFDRDGQTETFSGATLTELDGTPLPGWPVGDHGPGVWTGIVDDLDGDGRMEYVFADNQYVACFELGEGSYNLAGMEWFGGSFFLNPYGQNGQYDQAEPNDVPAKAYALAGMNGSYAGHIGKSGDADWFKLPIFGKWTAYVITLENIPAGADYNIAVVNSEQQDTVYCSGTKAGNAKESCIASNSVPNLSGYFLVKVSGKGAGDHNAVRPYLLGWEKNNY